MHTKMPYVGCCFKSSQEHFDASGQVSTEMLEEFLKESASGPLWIKGLRNVCRAASKATVWSGCLCKQISCFHVP